MSRAIDTRPGGLAVADKKKAREIWPTWSVDHRFRLGPRAGLGPRQEAILAMLENAWLAGSDRPANGEIARELGIAIRTVRNHVETLRRKGWLACAEPGIPPILSRKAIARLNGAGLARARLLADAGRSDVD